MYFLLHIFHFILHPNSQFCVMRYLNLSQLYR